MRIAVIHGSESFSRAAALLLILISLADRPKHGYAVTKAIAAFAEIRFGPGTLYGAIARLEARGLINALDADERRNPYELTPLGEKAQGATPTTADAVKGAWVILAGTAVIATWLQRQPVDPVYPQTLMQAAA